VRRPAESPLIAEHRCIGPAVFAFTSRHGGISRPPYDSLNLGLHVGDAETAVDENRDRVIQILRAQDRTWAEAEQVHGGQVAIAPRELLCAQSDGRAIAAGADALVTAERGLVLALFFADCVPVLLADEAGRAVGLAHAGWRGTAERCAANTVRALERTFGIRPKALRAILGPSVGGCCYEVGPEAGTAVTQTVSSAEGLAVSEGERWRLDLARINALQLINAGVPEAQIEIIDRCTCCEKDTFFSVRGEGKVTGRCGAFAWLE